MRLALVASAIASTCACGASTPSTPPTAVAEPRAAGLEALVGAYHQLGQFDGVVLVADAGRIVLPGFIHVLERIPAEHRVVIVRCNIRAPALYIDRLVTGIHAVLDGKPVEPPRRSAAITLAPSLGRGADAIRVELDRMATDAAHFYVDETEINALGYYALGRRKDPPAAVAILAFNARQFPSSVNVYDSLGEAELAAGNREAAIRNYRKVLELDPKNTNAKTVLERIGNSPK